MFKHLLVPLDGSPLAETALPTAAGLARILNARVTLLHVIEHNPPAEVHHARHLTNSDEACAYLNEVAHRAFPTEVRVECHVHTSEVRDVARSIAQHTLELEPDLIVMCTHGRSGPRRWLFGSNAQQVIALSKMPVVLIPHGLAGGPPAFACRRILVPLDGNPDHEQGLTVAVKLATAGEAAIHLVLVVPKPDTLKGERATTGKLLPLTTTVLLEMKLQGAATYLQSHLSALLTAGLPATAEVTRGDPAQAIVDAVQRSSADLIVLGTHGKTGMDAFWTGSITPAIADRSPVPLLLVPVRDDTE